APINNPPTKRKLRLESMGTSNPGGGGFPETHSPLVVLSQYSPALQVGGHSWACDKAQKNRINNIKNLFFI
ncbi:hypothetical protein, partial [Zunongwangia profunda]